MTEEFGVNGDIGRENRLTSMNGESAQVRVTRYKEERRKQLAGQFANLARSNGSSTSPSSSDCNLKKTSFRPLNSNVIKDDDARKQKLSTNNYKNPNKFRYKAADLSTDSSECRTKTSSSVTSPDPETGNALRSNRDKSAKRKSYLNRSSSVEKSPNSCHNNHHFSNSSDEGNARKYGTTSVAHSSLPTSVTVNSTCKSTLSSSSSHKTNPSPNYKKSILVNSQSRSLSHVRNGFAQFHKSAENADRSTVTGGKSSSVKDDIRSFECRARVEDGDMVDKSRIPRRIASPSRFFSRHIYSDFNADANSVCDKTSSQFPLQESSMNSSNKETNSQTNYYNKENFGHLCSNLLYDNGPNDHQYLQGEANEVAQRDSYSPSSAESSPKNFLLEIIQNFSEKSAVEGHDCDNFANSKSFTAEFDLKRSTSAKHISNSAQPSYCSASPQVTSLDIIEEDIASKPSILKNKFYERSSSLDLQKPNSILKRKPPSEDYGYHVPINTVRSICKQGILKKHSSLDEEEIRRRSCSPEVVFGKHQECKPILKTQRRSSLEELVRNRSPELHSILKRSKAVSEDNSDSGSSPHGILKRKISVTNILSTSPTGAESLLGCKDAFDGADTMVKPILKNKQNSSLELVMPETVYVDVPRPILKKPSTDTDNEDEKPKRPILKSSRRSLEEDMEHFSMDDTLSARLRLTTWNICENKGIKPILKKRITNYANSRCVKSDDDVVKDNYRKQSHIKRRSLPATIHQSFDVEENSISVAERVLDLENLSVEENFIDFNEIMQKTNVSRNLRFSRNAERYKTQPITHNEIISTKSDLENAHFTDPRRNRINAIEFAKSMDESQLRAGGAESSVEKENGEETSNDKAVINSLRRSNSVSMKASLFSQWEKDNKKAAEESRLKKKEERNANKRKLKIKCSDLVSRFATQPITSEEVEEAKKQREESRKTTQDIVRKEILENTPEKEVDKDEPSYLSFRERVKLFTQKMDRQNSVPQVCPKRAGSRFNTQPVTPVEIQIAKNFTQILLNSRKTDETATTKPLSDIKQNSKTVNKILTREVEKISSSLAEKRQTDSDSSAEQLSKEKSHLGDGPQRNHDSKTANNNFHRLSRDRPVLERTRAENWSETESQSEGDTSSSGGREIQEIINKKSHHETKRKQPVGVAVMNLGAVISGATDVVDAECPKINGNSSIAQRLAALQKSGQLDWKKRISRIAPEKELPPVININETQELLKKELANGFRTKLANANESPQDEKKDGTLAERLEKLETASQTWKKRVEPSDAVQFSVAGKMAASLTSVPLILPTSPLSEKKKRKPCPTRFKSFREKNEIHSTPISPEKSQSVNFTRSQSLPVEAIDSDDIDEAKPAVEEASVVNVPQIFDESFSTFFGTADSLRNTQNLADFDTDLNEIKSETTRLLTTHKKVKAQRKHATSRNPLKTLSTRIEIKNEYREVKTNIAEKEIKRINVEKLSKNSTLAVEVLAGLASKEDFAAVQLKKAGTPISAPLLPYKPLMLLHVKGRRHVQTRLVEPIVASVNSGDSFVLVTPSEVYHWSGQFSNVIEKSRAAEISQHILTTHDLGCTSATQVYTITEDSSKPNSKIARNFWVHLGATPEEAADIKAVKSGYPDEDEIYESSLISTNMVFEVAENELVPLEKYWGAVPKIQMLDPNKVLVFDFGSELYIWLGKNVDIKQRKSSVKLAKELWDNGFDYEECDVCPVTSVTTIGDREVDESKLIKRSKERPDWCLIAKVTQHMETVLFREKFLDWPDFSRVIRAKGSDEDTEKQNDGSIDVKPCDAKEMLEAPLEEPDLVLEGNHLGRGLQFYDENRKQFCLISTTNVRMWHVTEYESEPVPEESLAQFYSTNSYVIRWIYSITYTGRELSGQPSKHTVVGRDRCVYFYWQGKNASLNEQGAAALLTVELDKENGVQLRICQGYEPPAFFNLFKGRTVIYRNKETDKKWKLYVCRGEIDSEAYLMEVSCNIKQLRSRASFVLMNTSTGTTYVWHGSKVTKESSQACFSSVKNLKENTPPELGLKPDTTLTINEINEGSEPKEFFSGLGSNSRKLYLSLLDDKDNYNETPKLYNLSSNSGTFCATPIWNACRHKGYVTAYPFLQEDLYSASQPGLFMLDTGREIWLWQGWWPERGRHAEEPSSANNEVIQNTDNYRGSATVRWQAERRASMQTVLDYWNLKYPGKTVNAYLVWAGLEPVQFTNLFPDWHDRDDVAEMNISDGRKPGEILDVEQELARLTQSTYPIEQLLQRPLPDGVDPTKLELYLSSQHFKEVLNVTKEEFAALPSWKQTNLKKNAGLF